MRMFAVVFATLSFSALACESIPAEMKFKSLVGNFMTIYGDHTMTVEFVDLDTAECVRDARMNSFRIKDGARVTVRSGDKTVQSFTSGLTYSNRAFYVSKPANMVSGGVEVNMLPTGQVAMFFDGAAMKPSVTR